MMFNRVKKRVPEQVHLDTIELNRTAKRKCLVDRVFLITTATGTAFAKYPFALETLTVDQTLQLALAKPTVCLASPPLITWT